MPFQRVDALPVPPAEQVLPPQVVHVSVVVRILAHGQLQKGQILRPGLGRVGMVLHAQTGRADDPGRVAAGKHLVNRIDPAKAVTRVDFDCPKGHAVAAVRVE